MNKKYTAGGVLVIAGLVTAAIFGLDVEEGDIHLLITVDPGTTSQEVGQVILASTPVPTTTPVPAGSPTPTPGPSIWGRCDNPQTQDDLDYCKALGSGWVGTVRTVNFVTEAEANSINARTLKVKVNDAENPSSLISLP